MLSKKYLIILLVSLTMALASCKRDVDDTGLEYAPQMYVSKAYEPYTQVEAHKFNPYGMNMRAPVKGTVARSRFNPYFTNTDSAGKETKRFDLMIYNIHPDSMALAEKLLVNPYQPTEEVMKEGEVLYLRYCSPCHGEAGDGKGTVAGMYKGVPNYQAAAYKNLNSGHIFHTITHGKGRMWPHGSQLNPEERWKVVWWVHKLQGQEIKAGGVKTPEPKKDTTEVKKEK